MKLALLVNLCCKILISIFQRASKVFRTREREDRGGEKNLENAIKNFHFVLKEKRDEKNNNIIRGIIVYCKAWWGPSDFCSFSVSVSVSVSLFLYTYTCISFYNDYRIGLRFYQILLFVSLRCVRYSEQANESIVLCLWLEISFLRDWKGPFLWV